MSTTVTNLTATYMNATIPSLSLIVVLLLLGLTIAKDLSLTARNFRQHRGNPINVALAPLALAFALILTVQVAEFLR